MGILERIKDRGLKVGFVAGKAAINRGTIYNWDRGVKPSPDKMEALQKVADILGCHITDICPELGEAPHD